MTKFKKYLAIIQEENNVNKIMDENITLLIKKIINDYDFSTNRKIEEIYSLNSLLNNEFNEAIERIKQNLNNEKNKDSKDLKELKTVEFKSIDDDKLLNFADRTFYKNNIKNEIKQDKLIYIIEINLNKLPDDVYNLAESLAESLNIEKSDTKISQISKTIVSEYSDYAHNNCKTIIGNNKFTNNSDFNKILRSSILKDNNFIEIVKNKI